MSENHTGLCIGLREGKEVFFRTAADVIEQLQAKVNKATKQLLEYEQTEAMVCPEDVGVKEYVGLLKAQLDTARETNRKLHRRCQLAESAVKENIDECKRKGQSLGRRLAGAGYAMIEADVATTKAENERLRDNIEDAIERMDEEPAKEILEHALKCEHFEIFKWAEPPLEPGENGTLCSEERCSRKTGNLATDCGGNKEMCELPEALKE